jgi:glycosyltransferase involved in cell wall biosynthesis
MNESVPRQIWIHALGAKAGGGITYLSAILPELIGQLEGRGVRVVILLPRPLQDPALPDWVEARVLPLAARNAATRMFFDQFVLPLWLRPRRNAVLYCSGSFSPLIKTVPVVALLRNAIYFDDEFLGRVGPLGRLSLKLQGVLIALGARGCVSVHYPSRSMRSLVEDKYARLSRVGFVNSYGVGRSFARSPTGNGVPAARSQGPRSFLYVMNYTLQKNLAFVLQALVLAKERGVQVKVIVTSRLDDGPRSCAASDLALIEENDLVGSGYLELVGPRYGDDLLELYRSVDACLFPSICESFGHPLVEAMALGKPLVCADRPYAREICGDYAVYVDPNRPEELLTIWQDWPQAWKQVSAIDREDLLARFSWRSHVNNLIHALIGESSAEPAKETECVA